MTKSLAWSVQALPLLLIKVTALSHIGPQIVHTHVCPSMNSHAENERPLLYVHA